MTVAFDLQANLIVLEATIEGEPKRFLIDTGASASVVGNDTARDLGLEERRRFLGRGAGGDVALGMARVHSIAVGDSEVRNLTCMIMDLDGIEERIGGRVDGILGYDFLSRFVVTIDYPARAITLVPAGDHTSAPEMGFAIDGSVFRHEGFGLRVERPGTDWDFVTETPLPDIPVVLRHRGGGLLSIQLQTLHGLMLESAWPSIEASLPLQVQEFEKLSRGRRRPSAAVPHVLLHDRRHAAPADRPVRSRRVPFSGTELRGDRSKRGAGAARGSAIEGTSPLERR
jgi:hypothetical protein